MPFVKFTQVGRRDSQFISITQSNSFGFGGDFIAKYNLQAMPFVELYYDGETKQIGFKFSDAPGENSFKLIASKVSSSKSVVARSFFTTYLRDLKISEMENKYEPEKFNDPEHGELFIIKLATKEKK